MPRMRILSSSEQEAFDVPPVPGHQERKKVFHLPKALMDMVGKLRGNVPFFVETRLSGAA